MTEGIIQTVFKKVYSVHFSEFPISYLRIEQLEQELISEIEKEFNNYKCYLGCTNEEHLLRKKDVLKSLIGDTK
jgi:hypothetical protein